MQRLRRDDQVACMAVCPADVPRELCRSICSRAAEVNSIERGKIFNVPFEQPPITDLDTGTVDELAWASLGTRAFSRMPFRAAARDSLALAIAGVPPTPVVQNPADCPAQEGLPGVFFGWNQPFDALFKPQFVPTADQKFGRAVDLNQALAGYLVDPPLAQRDQYGAPLSWLKPTSGFQASQLPQGNPFFGEGFNLSQDVPQATVVNVLDQPTLFQRPRYSGARSNRLANLSA